MNKDFTIYIDEIIDSISHIEKYTNNVAIEHFQEDDYMQDAVIRRFQIIGEAAKRIPDEFKQNHQDVPWKLATGLRDVLIHNYNEVNLDRLWQTITEDLPGFKQQLETLSGEIEKEVLIDFKE